MSNILFEVCANSLQSAVAAEAGGADRIELCAQLEAGGITPSAATIKMTAAQLHIPIYILIRPRSGNFLYDAYDFAVMKEDILMAKSLGASGMVLGLLTADGDVDVERTSALVQLARPMKVTFHRAFDRARNPLTALEDVIKTGADRSLTSGQAASAYLGMDLLKDLMAQAGDRITILAGAGINPKNVLEIIKGTGVTEVHASCSALVPNGMDYISFLDSEKPHSVTDASIVKEIVTRIKSSI